jgi:hypothetical protein
MRDPTLRTIGGRDWGLILAVIALVETLLAIILKAR